MPPRQEKAVSGWKIRTRLVKVSDYLLVGRSAAAIGRVKILHGSGHGHFFVVGGDVEEAGVLGAFLEVGPVGDGLAILGGHADGEFVGFAEPVDHGGVLVAGGGGGAIFEAILAVDGLGAEGNKYEVHYVTPVNTMVKFFVWLTKDNTRPVRWMEPDRNRISMIDFTNFTPGPVDQKLFMPPDDYKKMPLPPRPNVITSVAPRPVLPGTPPPASVTPPETPKPAPPATTTNAPPLIAPAAIPVPAVKK